MGWERSSRPEAFLGETMVTNRAERAQRVAEKLGLKVEGFTPGPWIWISDDDNNVWNGIGPLEKLPTMSQLAGMGDPMKACVLGGVWRNDSNADIGLNGEKPEADASLIAAAPTLWNHLLDLEEEADKKELQVQDLLNRLEFERNSTNCDKLFRERQTKRHWQERAEKAEAALALRSELEEKKS